MPVSPRDPGLQPERTSLAWVRTLLGYGALLALGCLTATRLLHRKQDAPAR